MDEPRIKTVRWPDSATGPWWVDTYWSFVDQRWECVGLRLRSFDQDSEAEPRRVLATDLRGLRLGDLLAAQADEWAKAWRAQATKAGEGFVIDDSEEVVDAWLATLPKKPGRPRQYDRSHFQKVADVYAEAFVARRNPTKTVAERFQVSRSTAAKWVYRCRQMSLLGPTEKRQAGGVASPRKEGK